MNTTAAVMPEFVLVRLYVNTGTRRTMQIRAHGSIRDFFMMHMPKIIPNTAAMIAVPTFRQREMSNEYPCPEAYEENETYPDSAMRYMAVSQTQRSESEMSANGFPHTHRNAQNRAADAGGTQRSAVLLNDAREAAAEIKRQAAARTAIFACGASGEDGEVMPKASAINRDEPKVQAK